MSEIFNLPEQGTNRLRQQIDRNMRLIQESRAAMARREDGDPETCTGELLGRLQSAIDDIDLAERVDSAMLEIDKEELIHNLRWPTFREFPPEMDVHA